MNEHYRSDEYQRMAQRFVNPIFVKDQLGSIHFSSTMTFIKYNEQHFIVFAAHALPKEGVNSMGMLSTDGKFYCFDEFVSNVKVYEEHDLVICSTHESLDLKNYFEIDGKPNLNGFHKNVFNWVGFPQKKAKKQYHKSQASEEHIQKDITVMADGTLKWNNAEYLIIQSKIKTNNKVEISGEFDNKKVTYKYEGYKEQGYSAKGMSGGALFFGQKQRNVGSDLSKTFQFAGIGLEHNGKIIKGASRDQLVQLLNDFIGTSESIDFLELESQTE